MGTNSHIVIEVNHKLFGWIPFAIDVPERRDRLVYALVARVGVLNFSDLDEVPLAAPKGLPNNCAIETRNFFSQLNYHSHTWLNNREFSRIMMDVRLLRPSYPPETEWQTLEHVLGVLAHFYGQDNARVVLAFDN